MRYIGKNSNIQSPLDGCESYWIGDNVFIGPDVKISASKLVVGDYTKIHQGTVIYTQEEVYRGGYVYLGHNNWFGQNCVLDGSGGLYCGNNVAAGIGSHLYTHISKGDLLEGSRFNGTKEMRLGDDVWFVGMCLVSPIVAGNKSMAMLGSVVVKDMVENHVYAGSPAKDMTDRFGHAFEEVDVKTKRERLRQMIEEYDKGLLGSIVIKEDGGRHEEKTVFNVVDRTYTKRGTVDEVGLMQHLIRFRAKFVPLGEERPPLI